MTAKNEGRRVIREADAAAAEVLSLMSEMIGKHGMSLGAVLTGARRAIGMAQRLEPDAGIDLAAAPAAGRA